MTEAMKEAMKEIEELHREMLLLTGGAEISPEPALCREHLRWYMVYMCTVALLHRYVQTKGRQRIARGAWEGGDFLLMLYLANLIPKEKALNQIFMSIT